MIEVQLPPDTWRRVRGELDGWSYTPLLGPDGQQTIQGSVAGLPLVVSPPAPERASVALGLGAHGGVELEQDPPGEAPRRQRMRTPNMSSSFRR